MNLDPHLGRIDRIGSVVVGVGLAAYALLGDFDRTWLRAMFVVLGLMLAVGGFYGT